MDAGTIIERCGGLTAVAERTGAAINTVFYWRRRGSIPSERWPVLMELAHDRGEPLTIEELFQHQAERPKRTGAEVHS